MSTAEGRTVSPEDIQTVQNFIELCLSHYMTQEQVIEILSQQQNIDPTFTELVWQRLEEQNQEFFKRYYLKLTLKKQITEFNNLLAKQAILMNQVDQNGLAFRPVSNGSHIPPMYPENTNIIPEIGNMQHPVSTVSPSNLYHCEPSINLERQHTFGMPTHSRRINVPLNTMLTQNSNVGMIQGMNGLAIKTDTGYLGHPRFANQAGGNILEAHPTVDVASISSFSGMDSNPHQLNGSLANDTSSFEVFGHMSQNIGIPAFTDDFTDSTGENGTLHDTARNLGFQSFGRR